MIVCHGEGRQEQPPASVCAGKQALDSAHPPLLAPWEEANGSLKYSGATKRSAKLGGRRPKWDRCRAVPIGADRASRRELPWSQRGAVRCF